MAIQFEKTRPFYDMLISEVEMIESDKIRAVIRMQDYISQNIDNEITIGQLCSAATVEVKGNEWYE